MNSKKISITISNDHNEELDAVLKKSKINAITKSAIVDLALAKFFETATVDTIENEITEQIMGDA